MAHRQITDGEGVEWQVWEVIPSTAERRLASDRRLDPRDDDDRRRHVQFRVQLEDGMERGWLVFESASEKRRVFPVPPDWASWPDDELMALGRSGETASRSRAED